jgi:acetyl esterase/lipase
VGHKARLFTRAGYLFASVNYRLSPAIDGPPAADRVRFPDQPHDVGEALGWLRRNVRAYGGAPNRLVLVGHSAGAHLASLAGVDPAYAAVRGVPAAAVRGVVSLTPPRSTSPRRPTRSWRRIPR